MIRQRHFAPNRETRIDNAFQRPSTRPAAVVATTAFDEVTQAAEALAAAGVVVHLFDDTDPGRPDSVFSNNWLSTHAGGQVGIFPMHAPNRRTEYRHDIITFLKSAYRVQQVVDYSGMEADGIFLEGTGAMVFDHELRLAYAARSRRADPVLLERFCTMFGYEPMAFDAVDAAGVPIYHTNVMMMIGNSFAMIGLASITDPGRRSEIAGRLSAGGRREIIDLSHDQLRSFAGNALELDAGDHHVLALSTTALASLSAAQRAVIERHCAIVALDVPTLELAGGSVRCLLAGVHLEARDLAATGDGRSHAAPALAPAS